MHTSDDARIVDRSPLNGGQGLGGEPAGSATLGNRLLQLRLAHREERLRLVLSALNDRARAAATGAASGVPEPLTAAIAGFEQELQAIRAQRRDLDHPAAGPRQGHP